MVRLAQTAIVAVCLLLGLMSVAQAQMPTAGTLLSNQAFATYFNTELGITETVSSNVVSMRVNAFPSLRVERNQAMRLPPDTAEQFAFFVENTGNITLDPVITVTQAADDDFDVLLLRVVHDANDNGAIDAGERIFGAGDRVTLVPGQRENFVVSWRTPLTVSEDDRADIVFDAEDVDPIGATTTAPPMPPAHGDATGTVTIITSGPMIEKRASVSVASPGDAITYSVELKNGGSVDLVTMSEIDGLAVQVDNATTSAIVLRDTIPLRTTFDRVVDDGGLRAVYHVAGAPTHSYRSTPPSDLSTVDAVAFLSDTSLSPGERRLVQFDVRIADNAAGVELENVAETWQPDGAGGALRVLSNATVSTVRGTGGSLRFTDARYADDVDAVPLASNTFVEVDAGICNITSAIDRVAVRIQSDPEGDVETVTAIETGPNSGVFRTGAVPVQQQVPAVAENGVLSAERNTTATASATCDGRMLSDTLVVNAGGHVFSAVTNQGIPGVPLQLVTAGGQVVAQTVSGEDGFFQFEDVPPGDYRIVTAPPSGTRALTAARPFPGFDRQLEADGSFGGVFTVTSEQALFGFDIPLEPTGERAVTLDKRSETSVARLGETLQYEITVTNQADVAILNATIEDTLPRGFAYVARSARLDGVRIGEPSGAPGQQLVFDINRLAPRSEVTLTYVARILATAGRGRRTNRATATGMLAGTDQSVTSNVGTWTVEIDERGGVFSDRATVLGKVYFDCNANGHQDGPGEPGIPGVKIYLQDGRSVVTDGEGKYSLPDLRAVTQVFSVLSSTLPEGTHVLHSRTRDAGDPTTRFVDVKRGEVRQEDFPVGACGPDTVATVEERLVKYEPADGAQSRFKTDLPLREGRRRPLSANTQGDLGTTTEIVAGGAASEWAVFERPAGEGAQKTVEITRDLDTLVRSMSSDLGFVDLQDGDTLSRRTISVRIKGPARAVVGLEVNGEPVAGRQLGQRSIYASQDVQAHEYVAVRLKPGANTLDAVMKDPFGNVRGRETITVNAPGKAHGISIIAPDHAPADPNRPIPVVVRLVDSNGRLSAAPVEVTLEARSGHWDVDDIRKGEPGLQAFIDNGEAIFHFVPPALAGAHTIAVRSPYGKARHTFKLVPDASEEVLVGLVEGAIGFGENGSRLAPLMRRDELTPFDHTIEGVRGALFLKGRVLGSALLTLRYDSDKDTETRLFRDVRPDEFYPVYGDASERGFEAHSSEQLYVKVEKGLSYVLYGDIDVSAKSEAVRLGRYRRKLTGVRAHTEFSGVSVDVFAGELSSRKVVREFRGRGVSGPYSVDLDGFVENSEIVEIVTRDRDQRDVVVDEVRLTRFTDYTIDHFRGTIIFDTPVDAFDENLNPVFVRVTYDVEDGVEKHWIYGGEATYQVVDGILIGYREVHVDGDRSADGARTIRSAFGEVTLPLVGRGEIEVSHTDTPDGEAGWGARVSVEKRTDRTHVSVEAGQTDPDFDVSGASIARGRREARAKVRHEVADGVTAAGEVLYTEDTAPESQQITRYGAEARLTWRVSDELDATAGARYVVSEGSDRFGDDPVTAAIVGLKYQPSWLAGAVFNVEYEHDIANPGNGRFLFANAYQWSPELRIYSETEIASSQTGVFGLGETDTNRVIVKTGFEYKWSDAVVWFSEYRVSDRDIDGGAFAPDVGSDVLTNSFTQGAVANGLRGRWAITEAQSVDVKVEHVEPVSGSITDDRNTAVATGYTYEDNPARLFLRANVEWSKGDNREGWYSAASAAKGFGDITLIFQNRFAWDETDGEHRIRDRLRAGLAWRPTHHTDWTALAWYGLEFDDNESTRVREFSQSWSVGATYRASDRVRVRARHAGRHEIARFDDVSTSSVLLLMSGGLEFDVTERINLGLEGTVFGDVEGDSLHTGIGAEVGYRITDNVMASVGYKHADIDEKGIRDVYQDGFYVRLRAKLGPNAWRMLSGDFE